MKKKFLFQLQNLRSALGYLRVCLNPFALLRTHRNLGKTVGELSKQIESTIAFGHLGIEIGSETPRTSERDLQNLVRKLRIMEIDTKLVRLGSELDGGYVLPDILSEDLVCFSAGVHLNSDFEMDLARRGIRSHLIDFSVSGPAANDPLIGFTRKFLSSSTFMDSHVSLDDWVQSLEPDKELILKIDIEGSEWPVLQSASDSTLERFNLMVIEFHGLDRLGLAGPFSIMNATLNRLLKKFDIVNAHPNNYRGESTFFGARVPEVIELTLVNKRLGISGDHVAKTLRAPNLPNNPSAIDLELDNFWFEEDTPEK